VDLFHLSYGETAVAVSRRGAGSVLGPERN
jgi:hypothetical protein